MEIAPRWQRAGVRAQDDDRTEPGENNPPKSTVDYEKYRERTNFLENEYRWVGRGRGDIEATLFTTEPDQRRVSQGGPVGGRVFVGSVAAGGVLVEEPAEY